MTLCSLALCFVCFLFFVFFTDVRHGKKQKMTTVGYQPQHRSGCGMWVDQKDLKLYITGADMPRIHAAAALVGDLISKAPVNVNSAGVEDEVRV